MDMVRGRHCSTNLGLQLLLRLLAVLTTLVSLLHAILTQFLEVRLSTDKIIELLRDRARRYDRASYTTSSGDTFANSEDFPPALVAALSRTDPKALLFSSSPIPPNHASIRSETRSKLKSALASRVSNKRILVQSGGRDKLVPYDCSKPFLGFLKHAMEEGEQLTVDDRVYEGVGHRFTDEMLDEAVKWIAEVVGRSDRAKGPIWLSEGVAKTVSPNL